MNQDFERKEYFEFFSNFQSPFLNLTWEMELDDFSHECKKRNISRFQWLIYNLCRSLLTIDAFMWRLDSQGNPVRIANLAPSYTVLNNQKNFNFTSFNYDPHWPIFLESSLKSKAEAEGAMKLLKDESGRIDYIFITTIPWMRFSSIQHPIFDSKRVHIPSFAFGAFKQSDGRINFPFSVQAHHGFVDGYHLHLLDVEMRKNLLDFSSVDL